MHPLQKYLFLFQVCVLVCLVCLNKTAQTGNLKEDIIHFPGLQVATSSVCPYMALLLLLLQG